MFAVGAASLPWMSVLTGVMVYEKTRPSGARAVPLTGAVLLGGAAITLAYSMPQGQSDNRALPATRRGRSAEGADAANELKPSGVS